MDYLDFIIRIRGEAGAYQVSVQSEAGSESGYLDVDPDELLAATDEIAALIARPTRGVSPAFRRAQDFGQRLFSSMPESVRANYHRLIERSGPERGVRIKLDVEDPRLAYLPWEFLHDGEDFVARSTSTPLVRWPTGDVSVSSLTDSELRILVVIADPIDNRVPDVVNEKNALYLALSNKRGIQVDFLDDEEDNGDEPALRATLANVQAALRRAASKGKPYHAFHFIGHGHFDTGTGDGYLIFEDNDGRSKPASDDQIKWIIGDHTLRLVLLNACRGAQLDETDALAGVANSLVYAGIPAVVAMQFEITGLAASAFSSEFYEAILDGYPVDAAVAEGRKAILRELGEESIEWGTPVLFSRYTDSQLVNIVVPTASAPNVTVPPLTAQPKERETAVSGEPGDAADEPTVLPPVSEEQTASPSTRAASSTTESTTGTSASVLTGSPKTQAATRARRGSFNYVQSALAMVGVAAILFISYIIFIEESGDTSVEKSAVLSVIEQEVSFINQRDLDGVASLYTDQGWITDNNFTPDDESDDKGFSVREYYNSLFEAAWSKYKLDRVQVDYIDEDEAIVIHRGVIKDGITFPDLVTYELKNVDGEWKIDWLKFGRSAGDNALGGTVTAESAPSTSEQARPSAADAVVEYWMLVGENRCEEAWARLSSAFKRREHSNDYNAGYADWCLNQVKSARVLSATAIRSEGKTSTVEAQIVFNDNQTYVGTIEMVYDSDSGWWLLNRSRLQEQ